MRCTSEEYEDSYDNKTFLTEVLVEDVLRNVIRPNSARLREADRRYRLDDLLSSMLKDALHPLGIAVCLHIAHQKGEDGVVNAARA